MKLEVLFKNNDVEVYEDFKAITFKLTKERKYIIVETKDELDLKIFGNANVSRILELSKIKTLTVYEDNKIILKI